MLRVVMVWRHQLLRVVMVWRHQRMPSQSLFKNLYYVMKVPRIVREKVLRIVRKKVTRTNVKKVKKVRRMK
ncbi:unnamed protein product [Arabis nemorensis]|uniref:Uncharacterized protein n=1 Tax=Arabis nemorensis TaxID=586526 RepID=A0A565CXP6_9BRAS|nr:unnamed protein product [Arabis nemorensis]